MQGYHESSYHESNYHESGYQRYALAKVAAAVDRACERARPMEPRETPMGQPQLEIPQREPMQGELPPGESLRQWWRGPVLPVSFRSSFVAILNSF